MWKSSQKPALKVLLLVHYTAWGSCTAQKCCLSGKYLQGLFCLPLETFKEKLRTLRLFQKCAEGVNHYVLANTASFNKMIPLAIALAIANPLIAAGVCHDQCNATTQLFILDRALGHFGDLKNYTTNPTSASRSAHQISTCKLKEENTEPGSPGWQLWLPDRHLHSLQLPCPQCCIPWGSSVHSAAQHTGNTSTCVVYTYE